MKYSINGKYQTSWFLLIFHMAKYGRLYGKKFSFYIQKPIIGNLVFSFAISKSDSHIYTPLKNKKIVDCLTPSNTCTWSRQLRPNGNHESLKLHAWVYFILYAVHAFLVNLIEDDYFIV